MNAKVEQGSTDTVTVTIDGREIEAPKGAVIIEIADREGIDIPRFCYHPKLSRPANCRMCLVDVEMGGRPAPKPLPACATAVGDGMVVRTDSERAVKAQRGVMEFLLINHPLDCPICDQGGECELQDLAMGYGRGVSRFVERKRVVEDENLGPLIATEMTRCIHCTRCVRFLDEVAGTSELGGMYRGEHMEISTLVGSGVHSELSGNIIDLCPVGALTSKPYRYRARAWEMLSHASVSPHDAVGSALSVHHVGGTVKRVVPRANEAVNETWIADRDRFSYEGLHGEDRLRAPMVRVDGDWREATWEEALEHAVAGLRGIPGDELGALVSPSATLEEMYLLASLMRGLGSAHVDCRLRQGDFRDGPGSPGAAVGLGMELDRVERLEAVLFVGGNPRHDQPLLGHRLRQIARAGGAVHFLNPRAFEWNYEPTSERVAEPAAMATELAMLLAAAADQAGVERPEGLSKLLDGADPAPEHGEIAASLLAGEDTAVLVGNLVETSTEGALQRMLAARLAALSGSRYGAVGHGANAAGAVAAGALPGRDGGLDARAMLESPRRGYVTLGVEPEHDCWNAAAALSALRGAEFNLVITAWVSDAMRDYASVLLPVGAFTETAGTFINVAGRWQTFSGVARPPGEARPAWRLLRVLGNLLELDGFAHEAPDEIHDEVARAAGDGARPDLPAWDPALLSGVRSGRSGPWRIGSAAIYGVDGLVRRAPALQRTPLASGETLRVDASTAARIEVKDGDRVRVVQGEAASEAGVVIDAGLPPDTVWLASGSPAAAGMGPLEGEVSIERVVGADGH